MISGGGSMLTTAELIARNRRAFLASVDAFLQWGKSPEQLKADAQEDEAYFAQRRAELDSVAEQGDQQLKDERQYERMRAHDRAFG